MRNYNNNINNDSNSNNYNNYYNNSNNNSNNNYSNNNDNDNKTKLFWTNIQPPFLFFFNCLIVSLNKPNLFIKHAPQIIDLVRGAGGLFNAHQTPCL